MDGEFLKRGGDEGRTGERYLVDGGRGNGMGEVDSRGKREGAAERE